MQPQNPREIIVNILDIVGYGDEKNAFADEFLSLCQQNGLATLISTLPPEKITGKDPAQVIKENFTPAEYLEAVQKATEKQLADYIQTISPKLSKEQLKNLQSYLNSLHQTT